MLSLRRALRGEKFHGEFFFMNKKSLNLLQSCISLSCNRWDGGISGILKSQRISNRPHVGNQRYLSKRWYSSNKHESNPETGSPSPVEPPQPVIKSTASTLYSYTQALNHSYEDLERILMERIHESNKRRFRLTLFGLIIGVAWFFIVFGERISNWIRSMTTGLALETLEDKSIKIQTQELAMAVVQTVLNDKQVTAQAAAFLREAAQTPETQEALLKLTLHVLQHPDAIKELTTLTKHVITEITNDKVQISHNFFPFYFVRTRLPNSPNCYLKLFRIH